MAEKRRLDHIEERLGAVEGSESYAFADLAEKRRLDHIEERLGAIEGIPLAICPHFPAVHLQVVLGACSPLVLIEVGNLELWRDGDVRHEAQVRQVRKSITFTSFNGSKPFLSMIQPSLLCHSKRDSSCHKKQGLWLWEKRRAYLM